ncbi:unnamed protein product, partial [Symbiodinium necroappetens]
EVLKQALRLDKDAKLLVLLSDLPFQKSDLRQAFVEAFCEQADLENYHFLKLLEKRLLDLTLTSDETSVILDGALSLPRRAKLRVLLSELPFAASQLVEASIEPLLSAAKARDVYLAGSIVSRLLKAGVAASQTSGILEAARKLNMSAKLVILLSPLPFRSDDLVEALRNPLLSAADAGAVKVVQSIIERLLRANMEAAQTTGILEEAVKLKPSARLILLLSDLPFVASPSLQHFLTRLLLMFSKQHGAETFAIVKLIGTKLSACGMKKADADSILRSGIISGTSAQLRVLTSGLPFHSGTVRRLVPELASSLVEAAARKDTELVEEAERVLRHRGIRASHTSSFLERACHARCYSFIVHSTLPFEPRVLTSSLAEAYLRELVEGTHSENEFVQRYCSATEIEMALSRAGANQVAFLACVLLLAADTLPPDAPVIRHLLERLVHIGIAMPEADYLMDRIRPELSRLLSRSAMPFSEAALARTSAQLRVLTCGLPFHSGTVRRLVPELASSLVEAAARNDTELVEEAERVLRHRGIRASHTSSFLMRACHARCYSFIVHSTLPFEPRVLTSSLAEAYLQELVEKADAYWQIEPHWLVESDIELAFIRAGANQVAFLACVLLLAADTLPPDAPVIRHLLERLVHIGIATPEADYLMDRIRPELSRLLSRSAMAFSKAALARAGINHVKYRRGPENCWRQGIESTNAAELKESIMYFVGCAHAVFASCPSLSSATGHSWASRPEPRPWSFLCPKAMSFPIEEVAFNVLRAAKPEGAPIFHGWSGQPLRVPPEEYQRRLQAVKEFMDSDGISLLVVVQPEDLYYLTGLYTIGDSAPQALILPKDADPFLIARLIEFDLVPKLSWVAEAFTCPDSASIHDVFCHAVSKYLEPKCCVGLQLASISAAHYIRLRSFFDAAGAECVDASKTVEKARLQKFEFEQECIRAASAMSESALAAALNAVKPGKLLSDLHATAYSELIRAGSEVPGYVPIVRSTDPSGHGSWMPAEEVRPGNLVFLEHSACKFGHHAPLMRTAFVLNEGEASPPAWLLE